jgi:hypothetical protein
MEGGYSDSSGGGYSAPEPSTPNPDEDSGDGFVQVPDADTDDP